MPLTARFVLAVCLATSASAAPGAAPEGSPAHEAAEDAARAVPGGASKGVKACHEDIEKFCAKVKPGDGRVGRCLQKRMGKLSKPCRTYALHGGKSHSMKALLEIDSFLIGVSTPAASPAP